MLFINYFIGSFHHYDTPTPEPILTFSTVFRVETDNAFPTIKTELVGTGSLI